MPTPPAAAPSWLRQLGTRYGAHWALKTFGIPLFIAGFFVAYFHLLRHPVFAVTILPATALDRAIPFQPWALWAYVSLWPYIVIGAGTLRGRGEIARYLAAVVLVAVAGLGTFLLWPTAIPPSEIDWARHPEFQFLKAVDSPGNACPSLHVAFAAFTALWLERLLRTLGASPAVRALNAAWALAIAYSTLAIRQHVVVDVLAGLALGVAAGLIAPRSRVAPQDGQPRMGTTAHASRDRLK